MNDYTRTDCDVCHGTGNQPAPDEHLVCLSCSGMRQVYVNPPALVHVVPPPYVGTDEPPGRDV